MTSVSRADSVRELAALGPVLFVGGNVDRLGFPLAIVAIDPASTVRAARRGAVQVRIECLHQVHCAAVHVFAQQAPHAARVREVGNDEPPPFADRVFLRGWVGEAELEVVDRLKNAFAEVFVAAVFHSLLAGERAQYDFASESGGLIFAWFCCGARNEA